MSTMTNHMPAEPSGSMAGESAIEIEKQLIPSNSAQVFDQQAEQTEISPNTVSSTKMRQELEEKKKYWGFLEGRDAALCLSLSSVSVPAETSIDIPSLHSKLSSLLPGDKQLKRRARKLAWQLSKGKRVTCEWDNIFLSELTPAENRTSHEEFASLYSDQVKTPSNKGGRPRKYRTARAQRRGHAERQRRYKARKLVVVSGLTKTPRSLLRNKGLQTQK